MSTNIDSELLASQVSNGNTIEFPATGDSQGAYHSLGRGQKQGDYRGVIHI